MGGKVTNREVYEVFLKEEIINKEVWFYSLYYYHVYYEPACRKEDFKNR